MVESVTQQADFREHLGLRVWLGGCRAEQRGLAGKEGFRLQSVILQENPGEARMENRRAETSNPDAHVGSCVLPMGSLLRGSGRLSRVFLPWAPLQHMGKGVSLTSHSQVLSISLLILN